MIEFISKVFYYVLNKLRKFDFYYVCMIFVLRVKSRNFKGIELLKNQSGLLLKVDFKLKVKNNTNDEFPDFFDLRELKLRQQRLNYLIKFDESYILLDGAFRDLFIVQRKSISLLDTYTLSEIGVNHIFVSCVTQDSCNIGMLNLVLSRISNRLEFHPFGMTNNHFFRNIISALCISVAISDRLMFKVYSRYIQYFLNDYFSEDGLLLYEKSSSYQALFLKWQAQLLFIFKLHGIETEYTNLFMLNVTRHIGNYIDVLSKKIFIGDVTPDVSSEDLLNSLKFFTKYLNIKTATKSFIDTRSGHGMHYLDNNTMIYFVQNAQVFGASHAHFPSFNFVINQNNTKIIDDLGRINYTDDYIFQTKAENHNSVFFYNGSKASYLEFVYFDSGPGDITFHLSDSNSEDVMGSLRIASVEDSVYLTYDISFQRPRRLFFAFVHSTLANFSIQGVSITSCDEILSTSDYGVSGGYVKRSCFETFDSLLVHYVQFKISL